MTDLETQPDALARPGSLKRAWWLYLSTSGVVWVLWALACLAPLWGKDRGSGDLGIGIVYVEFVVGTVLVFTLNGLFWMPLAWLIDGKTGQTWLLYLAIGLVPGAAIGFVLGSTPGLALAAGLGVVVLGYVVGPLLGQLAFHSRGWRIAVVVVIAAALASVILVLL